MNKKLSFPEFIETYLSAETIAHSRSIVPLVDGTDLLELYSYELLVDDEADDDTSIISHPDYMEAGMDAYTDFLLDMQRAFAEKRLY